jgi:predicted permease
MERVIRDAKFAVRLLWRDRTFALTTLLTLAVCIGANAAIFAIINSVLLRPLPVPEPEQLVRIFNSYPRAGVERASNGVPDYYDRLREVDVFSEQALYNTRGLTIAATSAGGGDPQRMTGLIARPSLLRMLHVQPHRGRIFTEDEGEQGRDRQVMLTYGLWQQLFAASESVVGSTMRINSEPYTIIGILPADFTFVDPEIKLWVPLSFTAEERSDDSRHSNNWSMIGRLKPGASVAQAQQQLDALNARNMERFPAFREILTNAGFHTIATPFQADLVREIRGTLFLLWAGVLFVLLIGAVNITNLVLVRSSARMKEMATRLALGAGLSTLGRQILTETLLLTVLGGIGGLVLGRWGLTMLTGLGMSELPRGSEIQMDSTVVLFTFALALIVGVFVGLAPIVNMRHVNLSQAFREESRSGTSSRSARLLRRTLVASQVAFAFTLLVGAGLLLASFQRVLGVDPGFKPDNVLTARVSPPATRYAGDSELRTFDARLLESVRALPGVQHAGITSDIPFGGDYSDSVILAEGYQMAPGESLISPYRISVSRGYFEAMGMTPVYGRVFNDSDTDSSPRVVIVDQKLARRFWGDSNPVGRRMFKPDSAQDITKPGPKARWYTVIGVVPEIRISGFVAADDRVGAYYFAQPQEVERGVTLTIKTAGDPMAIAPLVRRAVSQIDPELPLYNVLSMRNRMDQSLVDRRTPMLLGLMFAGVALFLAALGIYGMLAYQVAQRRREIGIRMALGSDATRIFRMVLGEGLVLLAIGFAAGLAMAVAARGVLQTQLYGVGALDPRVIGSVALVLATAAVVACIVPARRAARIDPLVALADQ